VFALFWYVLPLITHAAVDCSTADNPAACACENKGGVLNLVSGLCEGGNDSVYTNAAADCSTADNPAACACENKGQVLNLGTGLCEGGGNNNGLGQDPASSGQNPASSGQNPGGSFSIVNPLKSTSIADGPDSFLMKIIDVLLLFAFPIVVLFIMYAGFLFVTARGNESQITTAKAALTWAIIGGVIALGAKAIIAVITGTIEAF